MSTLVAGYPVDERGVWHHNGPPFFLEVRHFSLDSAFQTLLHKLKATQCVNLSLIQQYKDKDSQHKDDESSKKLCLHLSRVPMSSAWNQTLFVGCKYLNCPVAEMDLTPNTSNPMIRNEISQRTFCDPLCRVTVPQMLLEGVHVECNLLPASHLWKKVLVKKGKNLQNQCFFSMKMPWKFLGKKNWKTFKISLFMTHEFFPPTQKIMKFPCFNEIWKHPQIQWQGFFHGASIHGFLMTCKIHGPSQDEMQSLITLKVS